MNTINHNVGIIETTSETTAHRGLNNNASNAPQLIERIFQQKLAIAENRVVGLEQELVISKKGQLVPTVKEGEGDFFVQCDARKTRDSIRQAPDIEQELTLAQAEVAEIKNRINNDDFSQTAWQKLDLKLAEMEKEHIDKLVESKRANLIHPNVGVSMMCSADGNDFGKLLKEQEAITKEVEQIKERIQSNDGYYSLDSTNLSNVLNQEQINEMAIDRDLILRDLQYDRSQIAANKLHKANEDPTLDIDETVKELRENTKDPTVSAEERAETKAEIRRIQNPDYQKAVKAEWQRLRSEAQTNIDSISSARSSKLSELKLVMNRITEMALAKDYHSVPRNNSYKASLDEFRTELELGYKRLHPMLADKRPSYDPIKSYTQLGKAQDALVKSFVHLNTANEEAYKQELQSIISNFDGNFASVVTDLMNINAVLNQ